MFGKLVHNLFMGLTTYLYGLQSIYYLATMCHGHPSNIKKMSSEFIVCHNMNMSQNLRVAAGLLQAKESSVIRVIAVPIGSMYGIFAYIYHKKPTKKNVGKYTSPMDPVGHHSSKKKQALKKNNFGDSPSQGVMYT